VVNQILPADGSGGPTSRNTRETPCTVAYLTGDLPIPRPGPYEEDADGERFRLCRVRASGRVRRHWLPKKDDGSEADTAFGPLRRHGLRRNFKIVPAADAKAPTSALEDFWQPEPCARPKTAFKAVHRPRPESKSEIAAASCAAASSRFGVHGRGASLQFKSSDSLWSRWRRCGARGLADLRRLAASR